MYKYRVCWGPRHVRADSQQQLGLLLLQVWVCFVREGVRAHVLHVHALEAYAWRRKKEEHGTCESEAHTSRNAAPSAAQNSFRRSRPSAIFASGSCLVGTIYLRAKVYPTCTEPAARGEKRPVVKLCSPYPRLFFFGITKTLGVDSCFYDKS